ncbi:metal ABC transporter permease [Pullulanibacillus sp. KACC 23026]|uniref:metal ABC transporter permease n=1 Tax=Pullulanibacillus sp. KACC 23026 TaxID=3028315 RepID=UPI0023B1B017|nr:metal ABC transporter permease [Pullulanibacillus sp. KACC 23026]WEG13670.1 metal ABC transporter permease [Pullulanibacillus sp. KACC 23026]
MLHFDFMRHAFIAGTIVSIMCGVIGVYVIARNHSFVAHVFSHIGFSGSSFAVYMGFNPLNGFLLFTVVSALAMGQMGVKVFRREVSINVILSLSLGLGLLFLSLSTKHANSMASLLFGNILGINANAVWQISLLSMLVLVLLFLGYRMLNFDSFDPVGAQAAGLPSRFISIAFLLLLAVATAEASQMVGALMVFTLMTIPAAAARHLSRSIGSMIVIAALIAIIGVWTGLVVGYYSNLPITFLITAFEGVLYFASFGWCVLRERMTPHEATAV